MNGEYGHPGREASQAEMAFWELGTGQEKAMMVSADVSKGLAVRRTVNEGVRNQALTMIASKAER